MINNFINKENLKNIMDFSNKNYLFEHIQELSFSIEDIYNYDKDVIPEDIEAIYYNAYFIIYNSLRLLGNGNNDKINDCLKKAANSLEILAKLDLDNLDSEDLIFDSMLTYYISGNYPCAYVLSKEFSDIILPKYKEVIFQFLNKNLVDLRVNVLRELNSDNLNEELIIKDLNEGKVDKWNALTKMLSYSIFKSLNDLLNFLYLGEDYIIEECLNLLSKYKNIALDNGFVEFWWIINSLEYLINKTYDNSLWKQLKSFKNSENSNLIESYIRNYLCRSKPIIELWPSQVKSIPKIIENNDNLTLKMPTSAGKTFVAELTILKFLMNRESFEKVVYISPFRSLSNEIEISLKSSLGKLGFKISEFYGGFDSNPYEYYVIEDLDILILTPEKFDAILRFYPNIKNDIGLIIIDEGHIIGDNDKRALNFEFLVYRLKNMFKKSRFLFISGVLPNITDFSKWLSGNDNNLIEEEWKPSEVLIGTLDWYKDKGAFINYKYKNSVPFTKNETIKFMDMFDKKEYFKSYPKRKKFPNKPNEALALSSLKFAKEAPTYVFSPTKPEIYSLTKKILDVLKILEEINMDCKLPIDLNDVDVKNLIDIIKQELGVKSELINYMENGFLIHHRDLPDNVKRGIENLLRKGKINLVIGTSTLVQGVNFPIKTVLLKGLNIGKKDIDFSTFSNICGRAGRAGEENEGRVLLVLDNIKKDNFYKKSKFNNLLNSNYILKSIFYLILRNIHKINKDYNNKNKIPISFEDVCRILSKEWDEYEIINNSILDYIDLLDSQLLAFIEEQNNEDINYLLNEIINISLFTIQSSDIGDFKSFIKSRLFYLKKEYSPINRKKMYKLGFNLRDCRFIESNFDYLNNLFYNFNWETLSDIEKNNLLFKIGKFVFNLNTISEVEPLDLLKEEILKYWIQGHSSIEIYNFINENDDLDLKLTTVNTFIKNCKYFIPWGLNSIITFLVEENKNNGDEKIPDVCEYFSEMFKYGVFDLKIVKLMSIFNNLELSKQLSNFIEESDNVDVIIEKIKLISERDDLSISLDYFNELNNYFNNSIGIKKNLKISIDLDDNLDLNIGDMIILNKNIDDSLSIFKLSGEFINTFKPLKYQFEEFKNENLRFKDIWKVDMINKDKLVLIN